MTDKPVVPRDTGGRVLAGHGGLPGAGRPKGSKNKLTELRDKFVEAVEENLPPSRLKKILSKIADQAEAGHFLSQKLIIDKLIPNASPADADETGGRGPTPQIVFTIRNATIAANREREGDIIDAQDVQVVSADEGSAGL